MFDKAKFKKCVDWYHANLDSLLPQYHGKYVACIDGKVRVCKRYDAFGC